MRRLAAVSMLVSVLGCGSEEDSPGLSRAGIGLPLTPSQLAQVEQQEPIRFRRIFSQWNQDFSYPPSPSPDGEFVTEVNWSTGNLGIRWISTGEWEPVTDKNGWGESSAMAEHSVVSRDGRRIAYSWFNGEGGYELRVIGTDGSDSRILVDAKAGITWFKPYDWTGDDRWILTRIYHSDGTRHMVLISAGDGSIRPVKQLDWSSPVSMSISPDDRYVAYDYRPQEDQIARDIYVLAVDGSVEAPVVGNAADDMLLGWTPDGSSLMYYSDRKIWKLPMEDGRAAGDPELVRADVWNLVPLGFTEESYLFGVNVAQEQVHTAVVDVPSGRVVRAPEPVTPTAERQTSWGAWSPDGKYLAYLASLPHHFGALLVIHGIESDETREMVLRVEDARALQWSSDGEALFVRGLDPEGEEGVTRVDLQSGDQHLVLPSGPRADDYTAPTLFFSVAPVGQALYFNEERWADRSGWISAHDLETGEARRIQRKAPTQSAVGFSPDGRTMAYADRDASSGRYEIRIAPIDGGDPTTVYRYPEGTGPPSHGPLATFEWTPDARHILFMEDGPMSGPPPMIRAVSVETGEAKTLLQAPGLRNMRLSPDGRHIAFETGESRYEVWVMEGF